ncbi:MAG TPA: DUF1464 family protein [Gemmatimonadaceae bacterium]|nr:DUF1464 family protein [Gemmatimonadaceae bacterium]
MTSRSRLDNGAPRVIGIDPGTVNIDVCGLAGDDVFLDQSIETAAALADPSAFLKILYEVAPVDLVVGPSGYGLPLVPGLELTEDDVRLAVLTGAGENDSGGLGGLSSLIRALASSRLPVVFTPGVVHLPSVPAYRKHNRVDMGTADKVCAVALAIDEQRRRRRCSPGDVSLILLELGGAFTAAVAVDRGRIIDGLGGTSGPIGRQGSGAWDGEVAYLADHVTKAMLFDGGTDDDIAYLESGLKAIAALRVSVPDPFEIVLSGRHALEFAEAFGARLSRPVHVLEGFAQTAKHAAQGAALIANGLSGGHARGLIDTLGLRDARGSVLDYLRVIPPEAARRRLGLVA